MQQQVTHANAEQHVNQDQQGKARTEGTEVDAVPARVANRNHQNRADIVGNRQSQNHHAERMRDLLAQNRHTAHHERDIRRRRDSPAVRRAVRSMRAKQQVDNRREQHTASRRDNRQARRLRVPQFPVGHLALHFQADVEEEYRHQRIVDEPVQVRGTEPAADRHGEWHVPEVMVRFRSQVRPEQGRHRHNDKNNTARRLHLHQALDRRDNLANRCFREKIFYFVATRYFC